MQCPQPLEGQAVKLTTKAIENLKNSGNKPTRHSDGGGLYIEVSPNGNKHWRMKYLYGGKEKRLSFGPFPLITLKEARLKRDAAKTKLAEGVDPGLEKKIAKAAAVESAKHTFEAVAREWSEVHFADKAPKHRDKVMSRLVNHLFPYIGQMPVDTVDAPALLACMKRAESKGRLETAGRIRGITGQIMRYAIATGRASRDPSSDLKGVIKTAQTQHYAALTQPDQVGQLMRAIDAYSATKPVEAALRLAPYLFVRPGELRQMEWSEVNFMRERWEIPAKKMKMKDPHIVPLPRQAMAILQDIHLLTGEGRYVFPGQRSAQRPLSENGIRTALRTLGYSNDQMTPHGFRAMARTLLDEELGFRPDWIEHQLAHAIKDPNGTAYNRTKHIKERAAMMQAYADYLDALREGVEIVQAAERYHA